MFFNTHSGGWVPRANQYGNEASNDNQWIQVEFDYPFNVAAIQTQGRNGWTEVWGSWSPTDGQYVSFYRISYGADGMNWEVYQNENGTDKVTFF